MIWGGIAPFGMKLSTNATPFGARAQCKIRGRGKGKRWIFIAQCCEHTLLKHSGMIWGGIATFGVKPN